MAVDTYLVNGVDLQGLAWGLSTAEGLQDGPELRGEDVFVPGMHGALDPFGETSAPRRRYDVGRIRFEMWVLGVNPTTGQAPASEDDLSAIFARLGELQRLFNARQLIIEHPRPDGARRTVARLAGPLKPVRQPSSPWFGQFVADCIIPGAFWTGAAPFTASATVTTGGGLALPALAGADAPITDAVLRFGPGSNPRLTQGGAYVQYDGVIPSGRELVVDCSLPQVAAGTGGAWTVADSNVRYAPGPGWFEIDPAAGALTLTHTGGGSMSVSVTARPKFLTS